MQIATPLQADHQLDQLAGQFARWRQTRTHPYEQIPQPLWDQAVALTATVPPSRVAHQLRVQLRDLKKQMGRRDAAPVVQAPIALGFVEMPVAPAGPQDAPTIQLELSRTDGTRLWLHAPAATLPLVAVVQVFLEGH